MFTSPITLLILALLLIVLPIFLVYYYLKKYLKKIENVELPNLKLIAYSIISVILWWIIWNFIALLLASLFPPVYLDFVKVIGGLIGLYLALFVLLKIEKVRSASKIASNVSWTVFGIFFIVGIVLSVVIMMFLPRF